jgi:hypothetical protein
MKIFHTNFYVLIELHELNQFKIRVIRLIVERLQSTCVEIFQHEISNKEHCDFYYAGLKIDIKILTIPKS